MIFFILPYIEKKMYFFTHKTFSYRQNTKHHSFHIKFSVFILYTMHKKIKKRTAVRFFIESYIIRFLLLPQRVKRVRLQV